MPETVTVLSEDLTTATALLADSLKASEPFKAYFAARRRFESDARAQALLEELQTAQAQLRLQQANGAVPKEESEKIRALQRRAQSDPAIQDYARTQEAAILDLREINQQISELLGVDFASLAKRTTC